MRKRIYEISLGLLLGSLLSACAIDPPNVPVCIEEDIASGFCVKTISGEDFVIDDHHPFSPSGDGKNLKSWLDMRPYMMLVPFDSWVEIKKFIINICKLSHACTGKVASWDRSVEVIDEHKAAKQN